MVAAGRVGNSSTSIRTMLPPPLWDRALKEISDGQIIVRIGSDDSSEIGRPDARCFEPGDDVDAKPVHHVSAVVLILADAVGVGIAVTVCVVLLSAKRVHSPARIETEFQLRPAANGGHSRGNP